jgi:hypothetical protein
MWARLSIVVGLVAGIAAAALLLGGILAFAPEPAPPVTPAPSVTLVTPTPVVSPSASTDAESPVASASASGSPDPSSPAADPSPPASPGG